jgi:hypothetical protein
LQSIKDCGALTCRDDIGTFSYSLQSGAAMSQALPAQIRELATRTAGVQLQRNKKNIEVVIGNNDVHFMSITNQ